MRTHTRTNTYAHNAVTLMQPTGVSELKRYDALISDNRSLVGRDASSVLNLKRD